MTKMPTLHNPLPQELEKEFEKVASIIDHFVKGVTPLDQKLIPEKVINNCKGVAVLTIVKAGFVWSGRAGSGLVLAKLPDGSWSAPSAIAAGGAGFGAQIGAEISDTILILNTEAAVKAFTYPGNVTFGGNLSVAVGPTGRQAEARASVGHHGVAPIYSYSKAKGLFAGLSIEGLVIFTRKETNAKFYNESVTPEELLNGSIPPPPQAEILYKALNNRGFGSGSSGYASLSRPQETATEPETGSMPRPPPSYEPPSASSLRNASSTPNLATKGPPPPPPRGSASKVVTAMFDFESERVGDLSFKTGDQIDVIEERGDGWWKGKLSRGGAEGTEEKRLQILQEDGPSAAIENIRFSSMLLFIITVLAIMTGFRISNEVATPLDFQAAVAANDFPGADAYTQLENIAQIPHMIYTEENMRIYSYLIDAFSEYKSTAVVPMEVWEFDSTLEYPQLFVYFPGTTNNTVLVSSHFDSREMAPGASDDGSGTVVMMQLARLFASGHGFAGPHRNSLLLFFNNGEEKHPDPRLNFTELARMEGAKRWVESEQWRPLLGSVKMFLNLEAGGAGGKPILLRSSTDKLTEVFTSVPYPHMNSFGGAFIKVLKSATDYEIYVDAGIPGLDLAYYENRRYYHTPEDNLNNISPSDIQYMGSNSLALVRSVMDADWIDDLVVENSAPFFGLMEYSPMILYTTVRWVLVAVLGFALVLLVALGVTSYKREFSDISVWNLIRVHMSYNTLVCIAGTVCGCLAFAVPFATGFYSSHQAMTGVWTAVPLLFIGCILSAYMVSAFWFKKQAADKASNTVRNAQVLSYAALVPGTLISLVFAALDLPLMYVLVFVGVARLAALCVWHFKPFVARSVGASAVVSEVVACASVCLVSVFPAVVMMDAVFVIIECTIGTTYMVISSVAMGLLSSIVGLPGFLGMRASTPLRKSVLWGCLAVWVALSAYALIITFI
ncbi:hypothetical protein HDU98_008593 [Podochytrium sp. JEL0797]|nr:hypothetical protein HDU98_008593 [Podochytrium sp. JEL0797]